MKYPSPGVWVGKECMWMEWCAPPSNPTIPHPKGCEAVTAQKQASDLLWGVETYGVISVQQIHFP